ncbi:MAG: hypothetical protein AAGA62_04170 [Bacteroidota bacterium]
MAKQTEELARLLAEFPELGNGLDVFLAEDREPVVGMVGIMLLLRLRLRAVLAHFPQSAPPDDGVPGAGQPSAATDDH